MTTTDPREEVKRMEAEFQSLIEKRNAARDAHDEPHFRWYAERANKLDDEIRQAKWEAKIQ